MEKIFSRHLTKFLGLTRYEWRLFFIRFTILGLTGYVVEVLFTGAHRLLDLLLERGVVWVLMNFGEATKANTGIMAFFVYCWSAFPLTFLLPLLRQWTRALGLKTVGFFLRSLLMALTFMAIEFTIGFLGIYVLGFPWESMWDYRGYPLNVMGVVTFLFLPAWWVAAVVGEWLHDRLLQVDDVLANPKGFSTTLLEERGVIEDTRVNFRKKLREVNARCLEYLHASSRSWNRSAIDYLFRAYKMHVDTIKYHIDRTNSVDDAAAVAYEIMDLDAYATRLVTAILEGGIYGS